MLLFVVIKAYHTSSSYCKIKLSLLFLLSCLWFSAMQWVFRSWILDSFFCLFFILLLFRLSWRSLKSIFNIDNLEWDKWSCESETHSLTWKNCWWCQFFQKLCLSTVLSWHIILSFLIWVCCSQFSVNKLLCLNQTNLFWIFLRRIVVVAFLFYFQIFLWDFNLNWNSADQFLKFFKKNNKISEQNQI